MVTSLDFYKHKITSYIHTCSKQIKHQDPQEIYLHSLTADSDIGWMKLEDAYYHFVKDDETKIPFFVWLLENPSSPISLPGSVDLRNHDYIHLLLNRGMSLFDEAFVVGYSMGNCETTNSQHIYIYKLFSNLLYPTLYKFNREHLKVFDIGFMYGRKVAIKNIHQIDFKEYHHQLIEDIRLQLGIHLCEVFQLWKSEKILTHSCT